MNVQRIIQLWCLFMTAACAAPTAPPQGHLFARVQGDLTFREIERNPTVSIIRTESRHFGGALGGGLFFSQCMGDLASARGFTHYVVLDSQMMRKGDQDDPGNASITVVGFLDVDLAELFPGRFDPKKQSSSILLSVSSANAFSNMMGESGDT